MDRGLLADVLEVSTPEEVLRLASDDALVALAYAEADALVRRAALLSVLAWSGRGSDPPEGHFLGVAVRAFEDAMRVTS